VCQLRRKQWQRSVRVAIQGTRKDKDLTQEEAAARMCWTQDIVSNIEAGRRDISVSEFIVLANELGVEPETHVSSCAALVTLKRPVL
jgi:transcriptional regulator with XRE-family HTH domain